VHQFTSVDAQFIAAEDGRVHGHVVGLAIYDDSERDGGRLTTADVRALVASRLHLIPPSRSTSTCPTGSTTPVSGSMTTSSSTSCRRPAASATSPHAPRRSPPRRST
jgi:hypothetical protein